MQDSPQDILSMVNKEIWTPCVSEEHGTTKSLLKYILPRGAMSVPSQFFLTLLSLSVSSKAPPWFPLESRGSKYALMPPVSSKAPPWFPLESRGSKYALMPHRSRIKSFAVVCTGAPSRLIGTCRVLSKLSSGDHGSRPPVLINPDVDSYRA